MPTVVIAPDKFRGSVTADAAARHLARGMEAASPGITTLCLPVADGGEGTVEAALSAGFDPVRARVRAPLGGFVDAIFAVRGRTALIELASASGLNLVHGKRDPLRASSHGTGDLIRAALDNGCDDIIVGLGGSACSDGGAGMVEALGGKLLNEAGGRVGPGGAELAGIAKLDLSGLDGRLGLAKIRVACDVDSPLLGPRGAAQTYGPQKGADSRSVAVLEAAMAHWADVVHAAIGSEHRFREGAGAAGGVGFACLALLRGHLAPGIETILDIVEFDGRLDSADLVVTGEGSLDDQTLRGKAPAGVARAAGRKGVPVVAVAGVSRLASADRRRLGIERLYLLSALEPDPELSMRHAPELLTRVGRQIASDFFPAPARELRRPS